MLNTYKTILKYTLYLYILSKYIYPALVRYLHFPGIPTLMFEIITILLLIIYYLISVASEKNSRTFKFFNSYRIYFVAIFAIVLISSLLNQDGWFLVIKSMIGYYFPFIVIFLLVANAGFTENEQINILKFLFALILFQIPFTLFQYFHFHYASADSNNGTIAYNLIGGTGIISVLESFLMSVAIAQLLFKGFNLKYFFLAIATFIPPLVGGAKFGFVALPFTILATTGSFAFLYKKVPISKYINMLMFFIVFGGVFLFIILTIIPQTKYAKYLELNVFENETAVKQYDQGAGKSHSRFEAYGILLNDYFTNEVDYTVGLGPSTITKSQSVDAKAGISFIVGLPDSVMVMASLGFIGLILFLIIFFMPIYLIKNYIEYEPNLNFQILACTFIPMTILSFVAMFYCPTWNSQIGMFYWIMLGIIVSRYKLFYEFKEVINLDILKGNINPIN